LPPGAFVRVVREDPKAPNVLYAGTERGIAVSLDRGAHWHALRLNMPATAIYDLQVQPQSNDLIAATHGRGVWILDDLQPIRAYASMATAAPVLFPPPDAYRMWQASPVNVFTDQTVPDNEYVGENRDPAIFSYYLPKAVAHVELDVVDDAGRIVKHLRGKKITGHAGINRTSWDLTEDGPLRWKRTFEQNRGPKSGPEVVPGTFTVRLVAGAERREAALVVKADPRDPSTATDAPLRHAALTALYAELSGVDAWLNALDARSPTASGAHAAAAFRARVTMDPRNVEDLNAPPGFRERLTDLLDRISSSSYQAPTAAQADEVEKLAATYADLTREAERLKL
jgi:hypothetical protein